MGPMRSQRGQASIEYLGVLAAGAIIVLAVVLAAPAIGAQIRCEMSGAVASILGNGEPECQGGDQASSEPATAGEPSTAAPPGAPAGFASGGDQAPAALLVSSAVPPTSGSDDLCRYARVLCEDLIPDGPDFGDEELYDVTFGNGAYVSLYQGATGAIIALYDLCGGDIECVVNELEARNIGPQEGTGAAQWNDAIAEDQWEDLEEAINDAKENGGCLNLHVRSGINWSTRDADDDTCQQGEPVSEGEPGTYAVTLDRDGAHVSIAEEPSGLLTQLYALCQNDGRCVAETLLDPPPEISNLAPELKAVLDELDSSQVTRALRDQALSEAEHEDLEDALGEIASNGGCLSVDVGADDAEWSRIAPGEGGCP